jgi:acyl transferase domain-containing protein
MLYGECPRLLDDTALAQPALFAFQYALARLWRSWGIEPAAVMGHSMGEFAAACVAGVFSVEDALGLVAERGRLVSKLPPGGTMVAVLASEARARDAMQGVPGRLVIAALNSAHNTVISGETTAISAAVSRLQAEGIVCKPLALSQAFHSPLMAPMVEAFEGAVRAVTLNPPQLPFVSGLTGAKADGAVATPAYWARHILEPVHYADGVRALHRLGPRTFLEIGPHSTLANLAAHTLDEPDCAFFSSLQRDAPAHDGMLSALAGLWTQGAPVRWKDFDFGRGRRLVSLPTAAFRRSRQWIERGRPAPLAVDPTGAHWLLGLRLHMATESDTLVYESRLSDSLPPSVGEHRLFGRPAVPIAAYVELAIAGAPRSHGEKAGSWTLEDLTASEPLLLADGRERIVQTTFAPDEAGAWSWRVFSRDAHEDDPKWLLHSSGRIRTGASDLSRRPSVNATFDAGSAEAARLFYDELGGAGVVLRPADRMLSKLRRAHGQAAGTFIPTHLARPMEGSVPSLLFDAVVQIAIATLPAMPSGGTWVPTGIKRLVVNEPAAEISSFEARCRADDETVVDGWLLDESGRVLAGAEGMSFLAVTPLAPPLPDLYQVNWIASSNASASSQSVAPKRCLILADDEGTGRALADVLHGRGVRCVLARRGSDFASDPGGGLRLRPGEARDYERLLEQFRETARGSPDAIVHLWSLDRPPALSPENARDAIEQGPGSAILLLQALLTQKAQDSRLWLATRKAQAAEKPPSSSGLLQSPLWGLGKTLALEHPENWGGLVDLDDDGPYSGAAALADEICSRSTEDHVAFRAGRRLVARVERAPPTIAGGSTPLRVDATYLVTGGLGSLGLAIAKALVAEGARSLVLLGRSGASSGEAQQAIEALEETGAAIKVVAIDVRDREELARLLKEIKAAMPPLRGVIHAAGAPDYGPIKRLTLAALDAALGPKMEGALAVRQAVEGTPLDFFACLSSMVASWGAVNQGAYAAANHFLDMLAFHDAGRRAVTISLGPLRGGMLPEGLAKRTERMGLRTYSMDRAASLLIGLLEPCGRQIVAAEVDWSRFKPLLETYRRRALLDRMERSPASSSAVETHASRLKERLSAAPAKQRQRILVEEVTREAARVLGIHPHAWPDLRRGFFDLGMNSLTSLELRRRLEKAVGSRLSATVVFDHPNVEALAAFLGRSLPDDPGQGSAPTRVARDVPVSEFPDGTSIDAALTAKLEQLERIVDGG